MKQKMLSSVVMKDDSWAFIFIPLCTHYFIFWAHHIFSRSTETDHFTKQFSTFNRAKYCSMLLTKNTWFRDLSTENLISKGFITVTLGISKTPCGKQQSFREPVPNTSVQHLRSADAVQESHIPGSTKMHTTSVWEPQSYRTHTANPAQPWWAHSKDMSMLYQQQNLPNTQTSFF